MLGFQWETTKSKGHFYKHVRRRDRKIAIQKSMPLHRMGASNPDFEISSRHPQLKLMQTYLKSPYIRLWGPGPSISKTSSRSSKGWAHWMLTYQVLDSVNCEKVMLEDD